MDEDQAKELIAKLDDLWLNGMTKAQADDIIEKLRTIASEVAELKQYVEKSGFPGA